MRGAANLHPNRVQQALTNPANSRDLAYGKVAHKVLDRLGIVRQMKLPVWFILKRKASLYQETGERKKKHSYFVGTYLSHGACIVKTRAVDRRMKCILWLASGIAAMEISNQVGKRLKAHLVSGNPCADRQLCLIKNPLTHPPDTFVRIQVVLCAILRDAGMNQTVRGFPWY